MHNLLQNSNSRPQSLCVQLRGCVRMFPCPSSKFYPIRFIAYLKELDELIKVSILLSTRTEYFRSYEAQKSEF